ncbi:MAG: endonuclease domain-containing protein [Verrucomicrobiia bacterium]|jgi:very-short-patch-repair endonuclease
MPSQITRLLRRRPTPAEKLLWRWLRGRRFSGFKFRRQHPIGDYVLDFYCCDARLDIELDGGGHNERAQELRDKRRDEFLKAKAFWCCAFQISRC